MILRSFLLLNVLSSFKQRLKGIQKEFFILPLLKPFLGSGTFPSNLSLLLASITLNFFYQYFDQFVLYF